MILSFRSGVSPFLAGLAGFVIIGLGTTSLRASDAV
jgi:hypothetical protein